MSWFQEHAELSLQFIRNTGVAKDGHITQIDFPEACVDVWHDRAVFHFLTDPLDRRRYVQTVLRAVKPGGHVIVATFAEDGPLRCSELDTVRYRPDTLHGEFGAVFELVNSADEVHHTPSGSDQKFIYCYCRR